jgi:hypothetical protein
MTFSWVTWKREHPDIERKVNEHLLTAEKDRFSNFGARLIILYHKMICVNKVLQMPTNWMDSLE